MKTVIPGLCLSLLFCNPTPAQERTVSAAKPKNVEAASEPRENANPTAAKLPVRRVVLYKNGVGYFEHLGRVRGSQDVHVDFTSAQLNDVLKSLTVLDLSGGKISGVDYNSEAPLARRLATLRLTLGENPTMADFLAALRGARLEVRSGSGAAMAGKLLSVEKKSREKDGATTEWTEISLVNDGGEVRSAEVTPATSVRIAEKDLQVEVGRYLGLIASSRDQDLRRMTISTTDLEDNVPPGVVLKNGEEAAAARLGDRRQHDWGRLERRGIVAGGGSTALVYSTAFAAVLREAAGGAATGERPIDAADACGNAGAFCPWGRRRHSRWSRGWRDGRCHRRPWERQRSR